MRIARRILILLALAAALAGCLTIGVGPLSISPPSNSGLPLLYADPGVRVRRDGVGDVAYEPGLVLLQGDTISTDTGQAVIDFDDDNVFALQSHTTIQLGSIRLFLGELFARIEQLTERGGGRVETDELSASVEGTEYAVQRRAGGTPGRAGTSQVIVRRGTVRCDPAAGATWAAVSLHPNQLLDVYGLRSAPAVRQVDARARTRWADQAIERLLQPRASAPNIGIQIPLGTAGGHRAQPKYDD